LYFTRVPYSIGVRWLNVKIVQFELMTRPTSPHRFALPRALTRRTFCASLCAITLTTDAAAKSAPVAVTATDAPLLVFAAASLKEPLDELLRAFTAASGVKARASFAGSNALAQQIDRGAPAALFLSADEAWMDYLVQRKRVLPHTRRSWLANELVLIAPAASNVAIDLTATAKARATLLERLANSRLALADPAAVPAGRYAQAALTKLDLWTAVASRIAPTDNVRSALTFVARGEAALGVVYRTDALAEPKVRVVAAFPGNTHSPITYPAAIVAAHDSEAARRLLDYLASDAATVIWQKHGFGRLSK
jgi:molybdate transport system substrate-binding protein